jgi:hypothetical protein
LNAIDMKDNSVKKRYLKGLCLSIIQQTPSFVIGH